MTIQPIETRYKGFRFRSRTEARWAVYFDFLGILWEYEKEGFQLSGGKYLPDFWLPQVAMWAEVKGQEPTSRELLLAKELADRSGFGCLILDGVPAPKPYIAYFGFDTSGDEVPNWTEYILTAKYLDESRFWSSPMDWENDFGTGRPFDDAGRAVNAARSARFEFGESG